MTASGDLQIVASVDTGGTGRREGEPVIYRWPWYRHLPRLGPWLLLSLAIVLPGTNRDRRALLILLPPLVLIVLWPPAATRIGMHPISIEEFALILESLVFGMALLWLNAEKLAKYHAGMRLVMSLGILFLAGVAVGASCGGPFSGDVAPLLLLTILPWIMLLTILAVTRRLVRRRYAPLGFMLWMGIGSVLLSVTGMAALAAVPRVSDELGYYGGEVLSAGLALGLCLYAINLPFMLLMFSSPFFRPRFLAWLGVATSSPRAGEDLC